MTKPAATLKTAEEIARIRQSCQLVSQTLGVVGQALRPGVSTWELDRLAEAFIRDHGATPAFKHYRPDRFGVPPFPATLCVSINHEVVHGIPSRTRCVQEGDLVSVDCGVLWNGFYGDSAYTFGVGVVSPQRQTLLDVTLACLHDGVAQAVAGNRVGHISHAVQRRAERAGFGVVREVVGHGLGRALHEDPDVPNFGWKWEGMRLREGLVIAIEPMITAGRRHVETADDDWTLYTRDGSMAAHFEHTVVVRPGQAEVLTTFDYIATTAERLPARKTALSA